MRYRTALQPQGLDRLALRRRAARTRSGADTRSAVDRPAPLQPAGLIQYFNGERRHFDLPLNQPGTEFQKQVWNELTAIPVAKTISYLDLARRTGDSKATRAVANANGKNNKRTLLPLRSERWIIFLSVSYREKSGAVWPIFIWFI